MGAPSAEVQSSQSSRSASKGDGQSASSDPGTGKGGQMSSMSGQPQMGQPNSNGNTDWDPIDPGYNISPTNRSDMANAPAATWGDGFAQQMSKEPQTWDQIQNQQLDYTKQAYQSAHPYETRMENPNSTFVARQDGITNANPYPNTIGGTSNSAGQPMGKGTSSNAASGGKGA